MLNDVIAEIEALRNATLSPSADVTAVAREIRQFVQILEANRRVLNNTQTQTGEFALIFTAVTSSAAPYAHNTGLATALQQGRTNARLLLSDVRDLTAHVLATYTLILADVSSRLIEIETSVPQAASVAARTSGLLLVVRPYILTQLTEVCVTVAWVVARSKTGVSVLMSTNEIFVQDLRWLPIHDGLHLHKSVYV